MIFKKLILAIISILMSVNFSAYTAEDSRTTKSTSNDATFNHGGTKKISNHIDNKTSNNDNELVDLNSGLDHGPQQDSTDQNLDDDSDDDTDDESIDPELEKVFLDFLRTIFSELDDIIKTAQENYALNDHPNDGTDFKKNCGCKLEIDKKYNHPVMHLCDKHNQEFDSLQVPTASSKTSTNTNDEVQKQNNCYPIDHLFIDADVDFYSDDWCELVFFDSPTRFIFRSSLLENC